MKQYEKNHRNVRLMFHGLDFYNSMMLYKKLILSFSLMSAEHIIKFIKPFQKMLLDEEIPLYIRYLFIYIIICEYFCEKQHIKALLCNNKRLTSIARASILPSDLRKWTEQRDAIRIGYIKKGLRSEDVLKLLNGNKESFERFDKIATEWYEKEKLREGYLK